MEITEHNISNWNLEKSEIEEIINLLRQEIKKYENDKPTQVYYGIILGKLMIMKAELGN